VRKPDRAVQALCSGPFILVDEAPESVAPDNPSHRSRWLAAGQRRPKAESTVRPSVVVVTPVVGAENSVVDQATRSWV
jgi:hypothetical protein